MDRFFLKPEEWGEGELVLTGSEAHHAARVMRKHVGDVIEVFDGQGRWARGEVVELSKSSLRIHLDAKGTSKAYSPEITLAVCLPKGKTMDWIVQKAVELGVSRIQPLTSANTVVKITGAEDALEKSEKWQRTALEACKQCGQNWLPEVLPVRPIHYWLETPRKGLKLVGALCGETLSLREVLESSDSEFHEVCLLVGPEGDFEDGEVGAAEREGFVPVTLGQLVLKVETACFLLLGAVRYRFG